MAWKNYIPRGNPPTITLTAPGQQIVAMIEELQKAIDGLEIIKGEGVEVSPSGSGPTGKKWTISLSDIGGANSPTTPDNPPSDDDGGGGGGSGAETMSLEIGNVETLPAGADATASITRGGANTMLLNLGIPRGSSGPTVQGVTFTVVTEMDKPSLVLDGSSLKAKIKFSTQTITLNSDGTWTKSSPVSQELTSDPGIGIVGCAAYTAQT